MQMTRCLLNEVHCIFFNANANSLHFFSGHFVDQNDIHIQRIVSLTCKNERKNNIRKSMIRYKIINNLAAIMRGEKVFYNGC